MAKENSCLTRVATGAVIGGAIGGAVGARISEDQAHWTKNSVECGSLWSFLRCRELDTLWEVILSSFLP
ncbi:hypothetical protein ACFX2I_007024 [Malus domestica]